jgi:hypothetical protein
MGMSVSLHWLMVGVIWMMLKSFGASPEAGWVAMVSLFMLFSFVVFLRYNSGKWKSIRLVTREPEAALPAEAAFHDLEY